MRVMMRALGFVVKVVALLVVGSASLAAADEVTVPVIDLLRNGAAFDGESITVEGELVGDYGFRRDGRMWTQLNDDSYARSPLVDGGPRSGGNIGIGVRVPGVVAADLDPPGGYRLRGPLVRLTGRWKYHDPDRGGESYLDVSTIEVLERGRRLEEGPDWIVFAVGVVLTAAASLLWANRPRSE
jgi:hypothetical protein